MEVDVIHELRVAQRNAVISGTGTLENLTRVNISYLMRDASVVLVSLGFRTVSQEGVVTGKRVRRWNETIPAGCCNPSCLGR